MKYKFLGAITAMSLMMTSCMIHIEKQSAEFTEKDVEVEAFKQINISTSAEVHFSIADSTSVHVKAQEGAWYGLQIETVDGVLTIHYDPFAHDDKLIPIITPSETKSVIYITAPSLENISVFGAGNVTCNDTIENENFEAKVVGSGKVTLAGVKGGSALLRVEGSGTVTAKSVKANETQYVVTGSGVVNAKQYDVENVFYLVTGSGDINAESVNCGAGNAQMTGSGTISLKGTMDTLEKNITGSGIIDTKELLLLRQK